MKKKISYIIIISAAVFFASCSPRVVSTKYYEENRTALDSIEQVYSKLYKEKPFIVGFTDKNFEKISLEITTDSLTYIYDFSANEKRLGDTLSKYGINTKEVLIMLGKMHDIRCTWVTNFDYFVDGEKKSLVFLSIKPLGLSRPFSNLRYYTITYFSQKQYYDRKGRLVNNRKQRQIQRLNGEIFKRINDKVCYTVSSTYR